MHLLTCFASPPTRWDLLSLMHTQAGSETQELRYSTVAMVHMVAICCHRCSGCAAPLSMSICASHTSLLLCCMLCQL